MKKILFVASECVPFIKTGGLADVCGALPKEFDKNYWDVRVVIPDYSCIPEQYRNNFEYVTHFYMSSGPYVQDKYVGVLKYEQDGITYYFIDNQEFFTGFSPYTSDTKFEIEKYTFFDKAVLSMLPLIDFKPDIIHCHDWQTGLLPVYLKNEFAANPFFWGIKTIITIHNLKFQGIWDREWVQGVSGLTDNLFTPDKLEFKKDANMLKGGLVYADYITTVSDTYANEIQTEYYGEGLNGLLSARHFDMQGIVNGIDYNAYDPQTDGRIYCNYNASDFRKKKFNNKTNGITFRRWLMSCNPELSAYITELIGDGWKKDANELEKLGNFINDDAVLTKLVDIKNAKKTELASYLKKTQNLDVPDNSIFDIQVKRLHEYKRQQLNVLYIIRKYFEIKAGKKPSTPITCFFGAKAAPAYIIAKDIIHAILCLQQIINNDPEVSPYLKVFMVENYNVTLAEKLFPAANISEQISLASKEASGTGNMKFMLNGAITLGTSDGANVEIAELVGDENIYVFGEDSQTVIDRYERGDYCSKDYYDKDADLKKAVDFLVSDEMMKVGSKENLERLYNELLNKDWFMTFPDFEDYCKTKEKAYADYEDKKAWAKKMLVNISKAGFFSSDRTIKQYNDEIWHLEA